MVSGGYFVWAILAIVSEFNGSTPERSFRGLHLVFTVVAGYAFVAVTRTALGPEEGLVVSMRAALVGFARAWWLGLGLLGLIGLYVGFVGDSVRLSIDTIWNIFRVRNRLSDSVDSRVSGAVDCAKDAAVSEGPGTESE